MIKLKFEKLYKDDRVNEHTAAAIPFPKGRLYNCDNITIERDGKCVPIQCKVTSKWGDGSIKWIYVRFLANLPGNGKTEYYCNINGKPDASEGLMTECGDNTITVNTGALCFKVSKGGGVFEYVSYGGITYPRECFAGPILRDGHGNAYDIDIEGWEIEENGSLCTVIRGIGCHSLGENKIKCEIVLTAYRDKPWLEMAYRLINTMYESLHIADLSFKFNAPATEGEVRTCVADCNYATDYIIGDDTVRKVIDAESLVYAGNEHTAEVFYGTLFADYSSMDSSGLCVSVYQAHQNFPKAVTADRDGLMVSLVPMDVGRVVMQSGMARQQRLLLHFHEAAEELASLNNRSIIYQMPDRPILDSSVYQEAELFDDVFVDQKIAEVERKLIHKADDHARCYGMLNWGDSPDPNYSQQGRGGGNSVWTNNEYDFSHACTLMYVRTGYRRFLDYMLVSSRHWMDVDICHFSDDPLVINGQWEHSPGHCIGSHMACSHEWVAGLLDYYHFTGDIDGYNAAIGIGENVMRILSSPEFQKYGALHARESGWALRTFVDLYNETNDAKWLDKCDWIAGHFEDWSRKFGGYWLAPYTDNTEIRVVFMIAVAINSLMRYYRVKPDDKIKKMIVDATDDLLENCVLESGLFLYKELPSLQKPSNPNILEALTYAYELTGDTKYLYAGLPTFRLFFSKPDSAEDFTKRIEGDAVICAGDGTKSFAQAFPPTAMFYKVCADKGIRLFEQA